MAKKKQIWQIGDVFSIELKNGMFTFGQIVSREASVLNSVTCAFFDYTIEDCTSMNVENLKNEQIFSVLFVTRDLLDKGVWAIIDSKEVTLQKSLFPFENTREKGFVGAKVYGAGIVSKFLNAFYGLHPWDAWYEPNYLDSLLLYSEKKPKNLIFKS